jgi:hypothetical protein
MNSSEQRGGKTAQCIEARSGYGGTRHSQYPLILYKSPTGSFIDLLPLQHFPPSIWYNEHPALPNAPVPSDGRDHSQLQTMDLACDQQAHRLRRLLLFARHTADLASLGSSGLLFGHITKGGIQRTSLGFPLRYRRE